jgi:hypothetical protein
VDMTTLKRQRRPLCFLDLCREAWDVIRKPYKNSNKTKIRSKSFPKDYLRASDKGVLYGHLERSGVLYGNHIYIVRSYNLEIMT